MPGEAIDLDRFTQPDDDPRRLAERRDLLIDQLAWLADEAEALGPLLAGLPEWAVSQTALPGERSVKSVLARIATLDAGQRSDWIHALDGPEAAELVREEPPAGDDDVADTSVAELLGRLRESRTRFLEMVHAVPAEMWTRPLTFDGGPATLYDVIMSIVRDDADELRALAYRLHDSGVGGRSAG